MWRPAALVIALFVAVNGVEERVCYSHLGCFSMTDPWLSWRRPVPPPDPPQAMKVRVLFFNRDTLDEKGHAISTWPEIALHGAAFDSTKRTFFIVHGFETLGTDEWLLNMKNAILQRIDANIFIGDWGRGAKGTSYFQAVGNVRMAARQFSNFFHYLIDQKNLNITMLELMGHSLGAQICGLIGKSIPGISRITGLDVAQPLFEGFGPEVKLTRDDALCVVTIHADARPFLPDLGFGFMNPVGHVSFFYNGAHSQPGCSFPKLLSVPKIKSISDFVAVPETLLRETLLCPHGLSHEFYTESISNPACIFWGHNATMKNMLRGVSNAATEGFFSKFLGFSDKCTYDTCSPVGLETCQWPARGVFVVNTRGSSPYCIPEEGIVPEKDQQMFIYKVQKNIYSSLLN